MCYSTELCLQLFFLLSKESWKNEICPISHWIPSFLFWRLTGKLTAHIIIKLERCFYHFQFLTLCNHPFISLSSPFLFTWVMTFLTSSIFPSLPSNFSIKHLSITISKFVIWIYFQSLALMHLRYVKIYDIFP